MNPIENEAVLHRIIKDAQGSVEIIDTKNELEKFGLKSLPGLTDWVLSDAKVEKFFRNFDQVEDTWKKVIHPDMFKDNCGKFDAQLRHCHRFLPHLNDDGGFFVAILKKVGPLPWESDFSKKSRKARNLSKNFNFSFENSLSADLKFLDSELNEDLIYSIGNKKKKFYSVTEKVKGIMEENVNEFNIFCAGAKVYKKNTSCHGSKIVAKDSGSDISIGKKRTIEIEKDDFEKLSNSVNAVKFEKLREVQKFCDISPGQVKIKCGLAEILCHLGISTIEVKSSLQKRNHCNRIL